MSHESVIASLNALSKTRAYHMDAAEHAKHMFRESDRAAIILNASATEHVLTYMLEEKLAGFNSDERDRMFGPQGPLGTFSSKIQFSQGLGIISRPIAKKLHVVRAMRNATAHFVGEFSFETPEVRNGVLQLISQKNQTEVATWDAYEIKGLFLHLLSLIQQAIGGVTPEHDEEESMALVRDTRTPQASPDTPAE